MIVRRRLAPYAIAAIVGVGVLSACQPPVPAPDTGPIGQGAVADGGTDVDATPTTEADGPSDTETAIREAVVALSRQQIGTPYASGAMKPGVAFDCSGLTTWVWKQAGVTLPRSSAAQYKATERIDEDELLPGDLVFYSSAGPNGAISHVALYAGDGRLVQAHKPGKPLSETDIDGYWKGHLVGYGRVEVTDDAVVPEVPETPSTTTTTVAD